MTHPLGSGETVTDSEHVPMKRVNHELYCGLFQEGMTDGQYLAE